MANQVKASSTVGIEIAEHQLHVASASYKNRKYRIDTLFSIPLDPNDHSSLHVKPLYMEGQQALLQNKMRDALVVTSLPEKDVLVRQMSLELKTEKEINAVFEFQIEPLLPYPLDEAIVDKILVEKSSDHSVLTTISCKNDKMAQHLELWHSIEIEPEVVGAVPFALAAFAEVFYPSAEPLVLFHVDENTTTAVLLQQNKLVASQTISKGLQSFSEFLPTALRLFYALKKNPQCHSLNQMAVVGPAAASSDFPLALSKELQLTLMNSETLQEQPHPVDVLLKRAVSIGNALMALPGVVNEVDFRQKTFAYPNPWKRIKKPLSIYLASSILLSVAVYLCGNAYLASQEDHLKQKYVDLLVSMKKNYSEMEAEAAKNPIQLTKEEIENRLQTLQKEIQTTPDIFPLQPNTPRVSDLLAWLNSLTVVKSGDGVPGEPRISLESLSYKMVKKPEQSRKMEKYQVKVDLEFSSPLPRYAREFHDFLLSPNELVDPSGEVKWSSERGKYRASFFLKDKTQYPGGR